MCILHLVLQYDGLSPLKCLRKTHRQKHHEFYEVMCHNSDLGIIRCHGNRTLATKFWFGSSSLTVRFGQLITFGAFGLIPISSFNKTGKKATTKMESETEE